MMKVLLDKEEKETGGGMKFPRQGREQNALENPKNFLIKIDPGKIIASRLD